ncbi:MAG: DUF393 domain-containing protein [Flavobacteriales bacterium]|nr:DUF393 domain-containing protein [Flavobacteriales bacterium]
MAVGPRVATILFDGDCGVCASWVRWLRARDGDHRFRYLPLRSEEGQALLDRFDLPRSPDSVVLLAHGTATLRSEAIAGILRNIPKWRWAGRLLALVPRSIRDLAYRIFARHRHRFASGNGGACALPEH